MATKDPIDIIATDWTLVSTTGWYTQNKTSEEIYFRFRTTKPTGNISGSDASIKSGTPHNNTIAEQCWMRIPGHNGPVVQLTLTEF